MTSTYTTANNELIVLREAKYFKIVREGHQSDVYSIYVHFSHIHRLRIYSASTETECKAELIKISEVLRLWD